MGTGVGGGTRTLLLDCPDAELDFRLSLLIHDFDIIQKKKKKKKLGEFFFFFYKEGMLAD